MDTAAVKPIRVLLIDDHEVMRAGIGLLLSSQIDLVAVGEAADREEALTLAARERPDVILLDLMLQDILSLDFLPALIEVSPHSRILVFTGVVDSGLHRNALLLGAAGLVRKDQPATALLRAIRAVHAGEVWFERGVMAGALFTLSQGEGTPPNPEADRIATLTQREREIIVLVGQRLKNQEIADCLFISESTVRHHLTAIFSKLDVSGRLDLMIYAYKHNLASKP